MVVGQVVEPGSGPLTRLRVRVVMMVMVVVSVVDCGRGDDAWVVDEPVKVVEEVRVDVKLEVRKGYGSERDGVF